MTIASIRPLTREDEDLALSIWNQSTAYDSLDRRQLQEKVWQDPNIADGCCWLAELSGNAVGMIVAVTRATETGRRGHIKLLATVPQARRKASPHSLLTGSSNNSWR